MQHHKALYSSIARHYTVVYYKPRTTQHHITLYSTAPRFINRTALDSAALPTPQIIMQYRATLAAQHFALRVLLIMLAAPLDGGSPPIPTARFETALLLAPLWSLKPAPLCFRSVSGLAPSVPFQWFWRHFLLLWVSFWSRHEHE